MDDYVTKADLNAAMLRVDERFSKLESGYGEMRGEIAEIRDGMRRLGEQQREQQREQQETNQQVLGALERQQAAIEALVQTVGKMQESLAEMREESAETRGELKVLGPALSEKLDAGREATEQQIAKLRLENERQLAELRRENEQALAAVRLELEQGLAGVRLDQERGRTFAHRIAATYAGASVAVVSAVAGALRAFG